MDTDKPVLGFRAWLLDRNYSLSPFGLDKEPWNSGLNYAKCEYCQNPPHRIHHCGFNAWYRMSDNLRYAYGGRVDVPVIGIIAGAGKLELHQFGFRSEQAQILAFFKPGLDSLEYLLSKDFWDPRKISLGTIINLVKDSHTYLEEVAERYSVPVFTERKELHSYIESLNINNEWARLDFKSNRKWRKIHSGGENKIKLGRLTLWFKDGKLHRDGDEPAIVSSFIGNKGDGCYFKHGLLHREGDSPAIICSGDKEWWVEGKRHRENDKPAVYNHSYGQSEYWVDGKRHRENNEPAVHSQITSDREYWFRGKRHRTNGPALTDINGENEYWINGELTCIGDKPSLIDYDTGTKEWHRDGILHRDRDLPAKIIDTSKSSKHLWFKNGKLHREKGPAYINYRAQKIAPQHYIVEKRWYNNGVFEKALLGNKSIKIVEDPDIKSISF